MQVTHFDRKLAAQAYAQAGMTDKAFEQLHLLATKFQWRGKAAFAEDELLKPLRNDARWRDIMQEFERNNQPNEVGFSIDHKRLEAINEELWGE